MTIEERVGKVFKMVFDDDALEIRPDMSASDVDGWDSLSHINLITAIEAEFSLRFSQKELLRQRNVGDLIADISGKLQA